MKKNVIYFSLLSVLLILGQALTSCLSDGDETVSLEFASAKKMIVGRWKLSAFDKDDTKQTVRKFPFANWKVPGTELTFYDDGTYYDSSDGGKKTHRWRLGPDGDSDSKPYYGNIYLDDNDFYIYTLGPGRWKLGYDPDDDDDGHIWTLGFDKDESAEIEEPDPEPETEERYLVSSIKRVVKSPYGNSLNSQSDYWFDYDGKGRITFVKSEGENKVFLQANQYRYDDEKNEIIVDDRGSYFNGMRAKLSDGKIATINFDGVGSDFGYDNAGYLQFARGSSAKPKWADGNLVSISNYSFAYTDEKNNANLDLNYFIDKESYVERHIWDGYIFGPLALYGKMSKNLVIPLRGYDLEAWKTYGKGSVRVTRNQAGLPIEIVYTNIDLHDAILTLTIEYTKKTVLK